MRQGKEKLICIVRRKIRSVIRKLGGRNISSFVKMTGNYSSIEIL